jgi:tetratricopeptide (TPR) repeat protein
VEEALALLRPAARGQIGVQHTSATLHSLLFTGHAHALAGRPAQALAAFTRYTAEVERRQVPRFAGRAVNFAGWVLRNLGAGQQALDHHQEALEVARRQGTAEVTIAALEDLAEHDLDGGDADRAQDRLAEALAVLQQGDLVFGWRLRLKHRLVTGRLALLRGQQEQALAEAAGLEAAATALGVPRYTCVARLLAHRANRALGVPVDLAVVAADLDLLDQSVAIEAWRWTFDVALDFANPAWLDRAADRVARLAAAAGPHADGLRRAADARLGRGGLSLSGPRAPSRKRAD